LAFSGLYIDSCAFIYALEEKDNEAYREAFRQLQRDIAFYLMHTSELTLAELLVLPHQNEDNVLIERYKRMFQTSNNGFVQVMPISTSVLTHAASFRGRQIQFLRRKPKLLDSIHAASADLTGCSHFITNDFRLKLWDQMMIVPATAEGISSFLKDIG
jgi:predicted nucleic acid-binding protein